MEYGTDAAYLLEPDGAGSIRFRCEKNRYGAMADIPTAFDPTIQKFTPAPAGLEAFDAATPAGLGHERVKGGLTCENSP